MPEWGDSGKIAYLLLVGALFFACTTSYLMPYHGMQLELTANYDERTRLTLWMSVVGKLSTLASAWVLAFVTSPVFSNPATGKPDIVLGMRSVCWLIMGVFVV